MKRTRFPGLIDIVQVSNPEDIRELVRHRQVDRRFDGRWPLLNGFLLGRVLRALSLHGRRLPTLRSRDDQDRNVGQESLWEKLNDRAASLTATNPDVQLLAHWLHGLGNDSELGILTQQAVGRLFVASYTADSASWEAALILNAAPNAKGIAAFSPRFKRRVKMAKQMLADKVNGDLAGLHGTGVALHNLVKGFHRMRLLYSDISRRSEWTHEAIGKECLFAPTVVLRQATAASEQSECPYHKNTVFLLELGSAQRHSDAKDMVFLNETWSRCPAEKWVPALLEAVWKCACDIGAEPLRGSISQPAHGRSQTETV